MRIAVLNGSPKADLSVTMRYVQFLAARFPEHEFRTVPVCHDLPAYERDEKAFQAAIDEIAAADVVLWAFPLYVMLVHSNYKRFIELVFERNAAAAFRGKYALAVSTSIRFFDHTAHAYVRAVSEDLEMRWLGGYSAEMYDLTKEPERARLEAFGRLALEAAAKGAAVPCATAPQIWPALRYEPGPISTPFNPGGRSIVILADLAPEADNLKDMVERLRRLLGDKATLVDLREINIRCGCQGCLRCALDNRCVFENADDVHSIYTGTLMNADAVVFASPIRDRYLTARFKMFLDRRFFLNHVPMLAGKQIGFLIAGPLRQNANLREMLEMFPCMDQANLAGIVTDECETSAELDSQLDDFARRLLEQMNAGYVGPPLFPAIGGKKLFRDAIWQDLRFVFHADHRYYKAHGLYDFPRRTWKQVAVQWLMPLLVKIPSFRREFLNRMAAEMVKPLDQSLEAMGSKK